MASPSDLVQRALDQFKSTISPDDERTFEDTTYKDLWEGIRGIEQEQGRRREMRFMKRIEPFLVSMDSYAKVIEVFSQGYPPMALVWVNILHREAWTTQLTTVALLGSYQTHNIRNAPSFRFRLV